MSIRDDRLTKTVVQRTVRETAFSGGIMDEGEDRFHKTFTPHTFRTVFTTLMRNQGMKQHVLRSVRGGAESETMDIYTRVDRNEAREEYLNRILGL